MAHKLLSRRAFLQTAAFGLGSLALRPWFSAARGSWHAHLQDFPQAERLGRVLDGQVEVKARPDIDSPTIGVLYEDAVVTWLREWVGSRPLWYNQRFVETPDGYIYSPNLQLVHNQPNQPLVALPSPGGMWVEVTVPYVDLALANPPARSPWLDHTLWPRLYYSQIMWVDQIQTDENGKALYHLAERYGSFGDTFWAPGEAFRPIQPEEVAPINPQVEDKLVVVDVTYQTMACYEGDSEVYFCRVSTGPKINSAENPDGKWATPPGLHTIWRKLFSVHMTGGTTGGGYDLPGIGWTTLFSSKGMAIHSTFWHNSYGVPHSHGCVNACPDDAKWVFRWTLPETPFDTGDVTISGQGSTKVQVIES
ncbi:MAG: L,D-transpeptidase [Anaerolineales bacterium]|nr:L,D-transpeptidase [Anaerolineales bacterium]